MKKTLAKVLMISLALGSLFSHAWAADAGDAALRKEVQAHFNSVAAMFDKKDVEGVVKTAAPGATLRYANGKNVTVEEWRAAALKEFPELATMRTKFKVEKVRSKGNTIVAVYTEIHDYKYAKDKKNKYRSVSRWSMTATRTPQGFRATHFVEFSEKTTRNGKTFMPKKHPNVT